MNDGSTKQLFNLGEAKTYTGTKTLKAWPLTRGEYNEYRLWTPPEDEDQTVPGYLVEYEGDDMPNDQRHAGYISWTPADAFNGTYRPSGTFYERLLIEGSELDVRLRKLRSFMDTPEFRALSPEDRNLLGAQAAHMQGYVDVLVKRVGRARPQD